MVADWPRSSVLDGQSLASRLAIEMVSSTLAVARCGGSRSLGVRLLLREWGTSRLGPNPHLGRARSCVCISTAAVQYTTVSRTSFLARSLSLSYPCFAGAFTAPATLGSCGPCSDRRFGVVATSGGLRLDEQRRFLALLAAVVMAFCGRFERLAREVPATQLAHMLGISLLGWSLLE